jgi:hypothetical protein
MTANVYTGEGDLASFTYAFSNTDSYRFLSNTDLYKHVVAFENGQEVQFIWFKDEHGG